MGRTSDTRMYNPRSESSEMFRANHEDERPPSGVEDAKDKEKRKDKKQAKREREEKEDNKIRHIKVRRHHLGIDDEKPDEPVEEEEEKFKPRGSTDNPANQTMPSGAGGFLYQSCYGSKRAVGPLAVRWFRCLSLWTSLGDCSNRTRLKKESKRSVKRRRKKEGYAKWRPSTGQFEKPKGGGDPRNITSRRSKNISRNLPLGRKTGLMRPHLSVEFSHRGLASKQPPSKDQQYRPYPRFARCS